MQRMTEAPMPWKRWEKARRLRHYRPLSQNVVYMPNVTINSKECLDNKSILITMIGGAKEETDVATFVKNVWKLRGAFRLSRVNRQSYKVGFYNESDYNRLKNSKWDHLGRDLVLARPWAASISVIEDVLNTVPLKATIRNILSAMWSDELIGRISSALGIPVEAKAASQCHPYIPHCWKRA